MMKSGFHRLWTNPLYRTIIQVLGIIVYFIVGCGFYYANEGWSISTTCFYSIVTLSTVGYGYTYPTNDGSRFFTIFYIIFGVYFAFSAIVDTVKTQLDVISNYVRKVSGDGTLESRYLHHQRVFWGCIACLVAAIFICGGVMSSIEDWSFITGLYFAIETASTVGYGDLELRNGSQSKPFVCFYLLVSIVLIAILVRNFVTIRKVKLAILQKEEILLKRRELQFLVDLDKGDGVSEEQFVLAILEHIGVLNRDKDILPWVEKFRTLRLNNHNKAQSKVLESFVQTETEEASKELDKVSNASGIFIEESNPLAIQGISLLLRHDKDDHMEF